MEWLITILGAIAAIFLVVVIHESGHFFVAKAVGVPVLRFSIGFGKPLLMFKSRAGTEYVIALFPLGGYVKLDDTQAGYHNQPLYKRMAIVLAGPAMNFLLAIVVFGIISLGENTYINPVVGQVVPDSIADQAELKFGDRIHAANDQRTRDWQDFLTIIIEHVGDKAPVKLAVQPQHNQSLQTRHLDLEPLKLAGRQPDILGLIGIKPFQPPFPAIVDQVLPQSPAADKGILPGDQITAFNQIPMTDWSALMAQIQNHPDQTVTLTVQRGESKQDVTVQLGSRQHLGKTQGYLGLAVKAPHWPKEMKETVYHSIWTVWKPAITKTWNLIVFNTDVLINMIRGKISLAALGGPITIFSTAGSASQQGLQVYLSFLGFISVTLGFINILPIPALDGGHFLFQIIEGIIGRPVPEKYQMWFLKLGIFLIVLLIIQATINDILRLLE